MDEQQRTKMTERLSSYAIFLGEVAARPDLSEVEVQRLRMIAEFLQPAEVEDESETGLNRWSVRDWSRRPRQTGMEQENERTILELLNIFAGLDIPFYILDGRGQKTGREYTPRQRLDLLRQKYEDMVKQLQAERERALNAEHREREAFTTVQQYETAIAAALGALKEHLPHAVLLNLNLIVEVPRGEPESVPELQPDAPTGG